MSKHWTPVSERHLTDILHSAEQQMDPALQQIWQLIRLPAPELWQQHPWGDEGCGFWVVAVFGKTCVYFNDISHGFNSSIFMKWGHIEDYLAGTDSLGAHLSALFQQHSAQTATTKAC